jgi:hypothetical protein
MEKFLDIIFILSVGLAMVSFFRIVKRHKKCIEELYKWSKDLEDKLNTMNYNQAGQVLNYLRNKQELSAEDKFLMEKCKKLIADYERIYKTPQN